MGIYVDLYTIGLKPYFLVLHNPNQYAIETVNNMVEDYCIVSARSANELFMKCALPEDAHNDLIELLENLETKKDIEDYTIYAITPSLQPAISFRNYDSEKQVWRINWESMISIINMGSFKDLDERLKSVKQVRLWPDEVDIAILKILDDNIFTEISEIQRKVNEPTFQRIYYHYVQHIEKRHLITSYRIRFDPYEEPNNYTTLYVTLSGSYDMAKFIDTFTSQIYVYGVSRVLGEPSLLIEFPINPIMKPGLDNFLEKLKDQKFIRDYKVFYADHAIEKSIPFHLYDISSETWTWRNKRLHNKHFLIN